MLKLHSSSKAVSLESGLDTLATQFMNDNVRRIAIAGLGREGMSTLEFLRAKFPEISLVLCDRMSKEEFWASNVVAKPLVGDVEVSLGSSYLEGLSRCDLVVKAPGIPADIPILQQFRLSGGQVTSNMGLFLRINPGFTIGVTGTKGKSTTSSLIAHVLRDALPDVRLIGNIGVPALSAIHGANNDTIFVIELSSYQLSDLNISPDIAVLQHIVAEHLDYHGSFESYVRAKSRIVQFQHPDDLTLFNSDSEPASGIARGSRARRIAFGFVQAPESGCFLEGDVMQVRENGTTKTAMTAADVPLLGHFNILNVMPSVLIGLQLGIDVEQIRKSVRCFRPLKHRLELFLDVNARQFYDDSISTVPEATVAALASLTDRPVILIGGGHDRGLDYSALCEAVLRHEVRAVILFPPTGDRILAELAAASEFTDSNSKMPAQFRVESMAEAVECALRLSRPGDVILLSPASASYGRFQNFEDRGEQFKSESKAQCMALGWTFSAQRQV